MDDYADLGLSVFLDRVADRTPTPGGGGVAALAGALACAMARMVAVYSVNSKTAPEARASVESANLQLQRADQLMRALITKDAEAYTALTEAAKAAREGAATEEMLQEAELVAISVPMEIAALASSALSTLDEFKEYASRYLLSDLAVAAVLAEASARAAAYSVRINARDISDGSLRARITGDTDNIIARCARHRESLEAYVCERLEIGSAHSR